MPHGWAMAILPVRRMLLKEENFTSGSGDAFQTFKVEIYNGTRTKTRAGGSEAFAYHKQEILLDCVLKLIRQRYPNPKDMRPLHQTQMGVSFTC